jgi:hypothetical protein
MCRIGMLSSRIQEYLAPKGCDVVGVSPRQAHGRTDEALQLGVGIRRDDLYRQRYPST